MSPKRCSVKDCKSKGDKVIFHEVPTSSKRQEKWKKALKTFLVDDIYEKALICNKHFKKSDYVPPVSGSRPSLLCKSAVPSIFPVAMPKKQQEVVVRPRHQSRRAASKEALKQMQILLEDEDDTVEIPDDDDEVIPIPVIVAPPKKKYKLSHRKSSDGNDREVLVLKSITPNITNHYGENNLELECWVEELEPCQKERKKKWEEDEIAMQSKLDELIKACKGEIVYKSDLSTVIEVSDQVQKTIQAFQAAMNKPPIVLNNTVATPPPGYQLVMDPRLGLIVGTVPSTNQAAKQGKIQVAANLQAPVTPASQGTSPSNIRRTRTKKTTPVAQQTPPPASPISTRTIPASKSAASIITTRSTPLIATRSLLGSKQVKRTAPQPSPVVPPTTRSRRDEPTPTVAASPATRSREPTPTVAASPATRSREPTPTVAASPATRSREPTPTVAASPATRSREPTPTIPTPPATRSRPGTGANPRPTETSVEGGLTTGSRPKAIVDLTTDDGRPLPDSREISFNKLQGKTFPSLVVVARPHLRVADVNSDRAKLDGKVKSVLMYAPTKFTEWLIQQGLVKSEQKCSIHASNQLKLGMYSDVSKFPYSGGYVWISECCPQRFVSVFSGSIFEGSPHPPLVILKILYHWSCQTNIQNVTQWVKVDNLYVKGMYTWLRSICTVALQSHIRQLGGPQTKVEVGVISLGTTSQDGNSRQVKVEVLGILETASKLIRLRAIEPLADGDRNYKKRFSKILEPLAQWVHPGSIIVTDLTVDKATLHQMGFSTVIQTTSVDANNSNRTIMEYLRRIVPRMFQNTLSLLSRQIIQQFLDELVWREWFGTSSMQAFENLITHLAEQTRVESNQSLIVKLNRVALNPFKSWSVTTAGTATAPAAAATAAAPKATATAPKATATAPKATDTATKKRKRKEAEPPKPAAAPALELNRPPKSNSPDVPEQMVPLENYYYGTIDNYPPKTNVTLNMKCPFCKEMFNNNIILMNHLFKHAHNVSLDGQMCRYCLTSVPTANDLLKHISTAHPSETKHDNGFVCLICETQYMNPFVLGKHMSKEHCPSELPYQCGTCGYKCSNHKQAIDHFYKQHDNGPTIQCPFCLKSTTVFSSSRNIAQNMHYFIQHLQKHQRKQYAKRCGKCNLWFVQKDILKDHQTKMHATQRGKTGLVPWIAPRNGVMVPKSKMDKYPCDAEGINFSTLFFNVSKNLKCKECDGLMETPKHFPSFESCQNPNCQYSTCCSNAMQEHNAKCNKNSQPNFPGEKLPYEMFCICGYSSGDGNQLAKHLAVCERKSAYPSLSDAKSASVTHSMLDVLGLVRKPEEAEKKQTAVTRRIKKASESKPEPETITLDEDEESVPKKMKREEVASESAVENKEKKSSTETVTEFMEVDALKEGINEETADDNSEKIIKKTDERDVSEKEADTIDASEKENNVEQISDTEVSMTKTRSSIQSAEKEQESDDLPVTKAIPSQLEPEGKETERADKEDDRERDPISEKAMSEKSEKEESNPISEIAETEKSEKEKSNPISENAETEKSEKEESNRISENAETEKSEKDESNPISENAETEKSENEESNRISENAETEKSEKDESNPISENAETEKSENEESDPISEKAETGKSEKEGSDPISEKAEIEEPDKEETDSISEKAEDEQCETISTMETNPPADDETSSKETEVEPFQSMEDEDKNGLLDETEVKQDDITETEDDLPSEEVNVDLTQNIEDEDKVTEETDARQSEITATEDDIESSKDTEIEHTSKTDETQLEDSVDSVESLTPKSQENETEDTEVSQEATEKSQQGDDQRLDDEVATGSDSETNKEQEPSTPVSESLNDHLDAEFTAETSKELELEAPLKEDVRDEPSTVSSSAEDPPFVTPGGYDDVSESSENAASSKYLEDPESVVNLGEPEQAGVMEVEETDKEERALDAMDYEDISNTGLDTLTSMDTD